MRWRRLESSRNVQDRRGTSGRAIGAGVGGLGIIGLLIALFLGGGAGGGGGLGGLEDLLVPVEPADVPTQQDPQFQGLDEAEDFVSRVLGSTETVWEQVFREAGAQYEPATLVLFSDFTRSGCGGANSQVGPHYCPLDRTIYIDLDFFGELQRRFGASAGDFAQAYVIAHEVGHHVQNLGGAMEQVRQLQQQDPANANEYSVALELQADCLAGIWAHSIWARDNVLQPGDIEEALSAAAAVGDDRIQQATTGQVNPESWTHGSSEQRMKWFSTGYESGDPGQCSTFEV